jgi:gluconolactonase
MMMIEHVRQPQSKSRQSKRSAVMAVVAAALATLSSSVGLSQILPPGAVVERIASGYSFTEGPVYINDDNDGGGVLFSGRHVPNWAILRYDIATKTTEVVDGESDGANGMTLDNNNQLLVAQEFTHSVTRRTTADVSVIQDVIADTWDGKSFNAPNDLEVDPRGGIYFTDADYGGRNNQPEGVYYVSPAGALSQVLTGYSRPNGITLSPDGSRLYLAEEPTKEIWAFDVNPSDGTLSNAVLFARTNVDANGDPISPPPGPGADGMTVDPAGNLYAAVHNAVYGWSPSGKRLLEIPVPGRPTNVEFGGVDGQTLFITSAGGLYQIGLNIVPEPCSVAPVAVSLVVIGALSRTRKRQ